MIKHVCISNKAVSFYTFNGYSKNTAANHHSHLAVLFKRKDFELWDFGGNHVVVLLDVSDLVRDYVLHSAAFECLTLFSGVEYWEIGEVLGQNVNEVLKV